MGFQFDIDECKGDPCLNGATCINEPGSFRCVCPPDKTGIYIFFEKYMLLINFVINIFITIRRYALW